VLIISTPCQISDIINGFYFTICSIFSNSDHVGWCTASTDTILKLDTLVMIQTQFGFNWSSSFIREDFFLKFTTDYDNGRQVMAIAHWSFELKILNGKTKKQLPK
jgi:hypothetical protein